MSSFRLWLFRGLVAVAASLMVTSFTMPWWIAKLSTVQVENPVRIYAYGLRHELVQLGGYLSGDVTPFYQTVLAWIYLAASVWLILFSTWLIGRRSRWLLGGIGLIYIVYATIAVIWVAIHSGDFNVSLQGHSFIISPGGGRLDIDASLRFGYYLSHAAGLMCIALALLRNRIIGKPKFNAQNAEQSAVSQKDE